MKDAVALHKECPVSHAKLTHVVTQRELRQTLKENRAIEVFCASCGQLHTLDAHERQRLSRLLKETE
jgi:redox-regulated HSP33 family molecular chaperone